MEVLLFTNKGPRYVFYWVLKGWTKKNCPFEKFRWLWRENGLSYIDHFRSSILISFSLQFAMLRDLDDCLAFLCSTFPKNPQTPLCAGSLQWSSMHHVIEATALTKVFCSSKAITTRQTSRYYIIYKGWSKKGFPFFWPTSDIDISKMVCGIYVLSLLTTRPVGPNL